MFSSFFGRKGEFSLAHSEGNTQKGDFRSVAVTWSVFSRDEWNSVGREMPGGVSGS